MSDQYVHILISISLDKDFIFWVHPYTGVLIVSRNDSKLTFHNKIALFDQLPPDRILEIPYGKVKAISFSQTSFAVGFSSGEVALVDNDSYTLTLIKKSLKKEILKLAISPTDRNLLVWLEEDKFYCYDLQKDKIIKDYKLKNEIPTNLDWLSDTKFIYTTTNGSIHYWDLTQNKEIKSIEKAHETQITCLTKHPRSLYTIITGDSNGEIKIWDLDEHKIYPDLVNSFTDKSFEITDIASSKLGDVLIVSDSKGLIKIYDMRNPRGEKLIFFLNTNENIRQIIPSTQNGEFLVLHQDGSIKLYQGFSIDNINQEFQNFQVEMKNFTKKLDQLPHWLTENGLEAIIPSEIPIIEKNLDLALRLLSPPLLEKSSSLWMREYFNEYFKKFIMLERSIHQIIEETRSSVQKKKEEVTKTSDLSKKLEQDLVHYLSIQKGKISLDQISLYFNIPTDSILSLIQKLEKEKMLNGSLISEYSGYFFEISEGKSERSEGGSKEIDIITCHNCGTDYDIVMKNCPHCKAETTFCESCSKPIQKRQMIINCPHCKAYFHTACFESKVKLFGRCSKCHESVDFDSLIKNSVEEQKKQDKIVSGLSKLLSKQATFVKQMDKDEDDDLFDF